MLKTFNNYTKDNLSSCIYILGLFLLKSVTRIGLHIDYVIMNLWNEEDKDNKMYFVKIDSWVSWASNLYYRSNWGVHLQEWNSKELTGARTSGGACGSIRCKAKNLTRAWHAVNPLEREECLRERRHRWCILMSFRDLSSCHKCINYSHVWEVMIHLCKWQIICSKTLSPCSMKSAPNMLEILLDKSA